MNQKCVAAYVDGIVQGVGFRFYTQRQARMLSLTGYAYNMDDGRVEIIACGEEQNVEALLSWLKAGGPKSAKVTQVLIEPRPVKEYREFEIKH